MWLWLHRGLSCDPALHVVVLHAARIILRVVCEENQAAGTADGTDMFDWTSFQCLPEGMLFSVTGSQFQMSMDAL